MNYPNYANYGRTTPKPSYTTQGYGPSYERSIVGAGSEISKGKNHWDNPVAHRRETPTGTYKHPSYYIAPNPKEETKREATRGKNGYPPAPFSWEKEERRREIENERIDKQNRERDARLKHSKPDTTSWQLNDNALERQREENKKEEYRREEIRRLDDERRQREKMEQNEYRRKLDKEGEEKERRQREQNEYRRKLDREREEKERRDKEKENTYSYQAGTGYNKHHGSSRFYNEEEKEQSLTKGFAQMSIRGIRGLNNLGNTCYLNATLQCLLNTAPFVKYFVQEKGEQRDRNRKSPYSGKLAIEFAELISSYQTNSKTALSADRIKYYIGKSNSQFCSYMQADAQEAMTYILDGLHEDLNRVISKTKYIEMKQTKESYSLQSAQWYKYSLTRDNSIITDIFQGQMLSETRCPKCDEVSIAFDNFQSLSLQIPKSRTMITHSTTLEQCLDDFTKEENLTDSFKCGGCKRVGNAFRKLSLWRLPEILIIHLKRFKYSTWRKEKLDTCVKFPLNNLNLKRYTAKENAFCAKGTKIGLQHESIANPLYQLYGIVHHRGTIYGGHYIADCENIHSKEWNSFNDSRISPCHSISTDSSSPYLLFYQKVY